MTLHPYCTLFSSHHSLTHRLIARSLHALPESHYTRAPDALPHNPQVCPSRCALLTHTKARQAARHATSSLLVGRNQIAQWLESARQLVDQDLRLHLLHLCANSLCNGGSLDRCCYVVGGHQRLTEHFAHIRLPIPGEVRAGTSARRGLHSGAHPERSDAERRLRA